MNEPIKAINASWMNSLNKPDNIKMKAVMWEDEDVWDVSQGKYIKGMEYDTLYGHPQRRYIVDKETGIEMLYCEYSKKQPVKEGKTFNFIKPLIEPYFHIGMGIEIKGKKQYRDELRARNLVEVGTEKSTQMRNPQRKIK